MSLVIAVIMPVQIFTYSTTRFKLDTRVYQTCVCSIDFSSSFLKLTSVRVLYIYTRMHENNTTTQI